MAEPSHRVLLRRFPGKEKSGKPKQQHQYKSDQRGIKYTNRGAYKVLLWTRS